MQYRRYTIFALEGITIEEHLHLIQRHLWAFVSFHALLYRNQITTGPLPGLRTEAHGAEIGLLLLERRSSRPPRFPHTIRNRDLLSPADWKDINVQGRVVVTA